MQTKPQNLAKALSPKILSHSEDQEEEEEEENNKEVCVIFHDPNSNPNTEEKWNWDKVCS